MPHLWTGIIFFLLYFCHISKMFTCVIRTVVSKITCLYLGFTCPSPGRWASVNIESCFGQVSLLNRKVVGHTILTLTLWSPGNLERESRKYHLVTLLLTLWPIDAMVLLKIYLIVLLQDLEFRTYQKGNSLKALTCNISLVKA